MIRAVLAAAFTYACYKWISYAEGDYIGFLDSTDKWETGALMYTDSFFEMILM